MLLFIILKANRKNKSTDKKRNPLRSKTKKAFQNLPHITLSPPYQSETDTSPQPPSHHRTTGLLTQIEPEHQKKLYKKNPKSKTPPKEGS